VASSIVEIGANALRLLGADPITSLGDNTERARLVSALWPQARRAVLRAHPWKFAIEYTTLAKLATGPAWKFKNAFQLPVEPYCLRVLATSLDDLDIPWKLSGRTLVTNAGDVKIEYLADVTDVGAYDSAFEAAVTARLAADLAYPVTSSTSLGAAMWALYTEKMKEARFLDGLEQSPLRVRADDLVTVRR